VRPSGACRASTCVLVSLRIPFVALPQRVPPRRPSQRDPADSCPLSVFQTGLSDIPLTQKGEDILRELGGRIVGKGKVLDPAHIQHVFVSPRQRAQKTFSLLFDDRGVDVPSYSTEDGVREWDYGVCEGASLALAPSFPLLAALRAAQGCAAVDRIDADADLVLCAGKKTAEIRSELGEDWDIWTMGCPEGESPDEMTARCDAMIEKVVDLAECVPSPPLLVPLTRRRPRVRLTCLLLVSQRSPRQGGDGGLPRRHRHHLARPLQPLLHVRPPCPRSPVRRRRGSPSLSGHPRSLSPYRADPPPSLLSLVTPHRTRWCKLNLSQGRIFVADTGALHKLGFQHRNFDERSLLGLNLYSVEE